MLNFQFHNKVDFQLQSEEGDIGTFIANGEWALLGMFHCLDIPPRQLLIS